MESRAIHNIVQLIEAELFSEAPGVQVWQMVHGGS